MNKLVIALTIMLIYSCQDSQNPSPIKVENEKIEDKIDQNITRVEYLQSKEQASLNLPFSEAVRIDNILYLSGQVGTLPNSTNLVEGGIGPETIQTMENIKSVLERYGSSMDQIFKCTCMLADISEWSDMNAEYIKFFPDKKPARSALGASGLALGARVEIECMAYIK